MSLPILIKPSRFFGRAFLLLSLCIDECRL